MHDVDPSLKHEPIPHRCVEYDLDARSPALLWARCSCGWSPPSELIEKTISALMEHYAQASEAALGAEKAELRIGIGKAEFNSGKKKELKRNLHRSREAFKKSVAERDALQARLDAVRALCDEVEAEHIADQKRQGVSEEYIYPEDGLLAVKRVRAVIERG